MTHWLDKLRSIRTRITMPSHEDVSRYTRPVDDDEVIDAVKAVPTHFTGVGIQNNDTTDQYVSPNTSGTHNFTITAGSNLALCLLINFGVNTGHAVPTGVTVTWNSVSMTSLVSQISNVASQFNGGSVIFGLLNPSSGSHSFAVSWTNTAEAFLWAICFNNVKQTSLATAFPNIGGTVFTSGTGLNPIEANVTSTSTNNIVLACQVANSAGLGGGTQLYYDHTNGNYVNCGANYYTGGTTTTVGANASGLSVAGVEVAAIPPSGSVFVPATMTGMGTGGPFFGDKPLTKREYSFPDVPSRRRRRYSLTNKDYCNG